MLRMLLILVFDCRCLTTRDGTWNAIVATDMYCTRGEVHCYPSDNDEARIFKGVLAAFAQAESTDGTGHVTLVAVINVSVDEVRLVPYLARSLERYLIKEPLA